MSAALKIFIIYAREDKGYKEDLLKSLKLLQNQGLIEPWHDSDIKPGDEWDKEIKAHLRAADIILPIISFDFFNSEYIHQVEIVEAFERYDRDEVVIIPIIADSCPWGDYPRLKGLQALPAEAKAIDDWPDKKRAMTSIYEGVRRIINARKLQEEERRKDLDRKRTEARYLFNRGIESKNLSDKIEFFSEAIFVYPNYPEAFYSRGIAKYNAGNFDDAILDFNKTIQLDPTFAHAYNNRCAAKEKMNQYRGAKNDYSRALEIDPDLEDAKKNLQRLKTKMKQNP